MARNDPVAKLASSSLMADASPYALLVTWHKIQSRGQRAAPGLLRRLQVGPPAAHFRARPRLGVLQDRDQRAPRRREMSGTGIRACVGRRTLPCSSITASTVRTFTPRAAVHSARSREKEIRVGRLTFRIKDGEIWDVDHEDYHQAQDHEHAESCSSGPVLCA